MNVIDTLQDLVRINSVNPNYDGGVPEAAMADYVESFFQRLGLETWRQECYPDRPNVIAKLPGRDGNRRIILEAHTDTVSTTGMTIDPFAADIRDGKLYGRGACDTKGGMAAMMHAVAELAKANITPACDVLFTATIDEEFSYRGVIGLCHSLDPGSVPPEVMRGDIPAQPNWHADAAIVAEPTSLQCVAAGKGLVRWQIETRGVAAHSAKPHLGVNAIQHMAHIIRAIEQHTEQLMQQVHPLLGPATCNIGVVRGGVQVNFVPDRCTIEIDRRLLPSENRDQVLADYQQLVDQVAGRHENMDVVMHPPMLTDRSLETDVNDPVVTTMGKVLREQNLPSDPIGVPFCSDASKFCALGIPTIIFGPGSIDQAHAAVEFIECFEVVRAVEILRQFIINWESKT